MRLLADESVTGRVQRFLRTLDCELLTVSQLGRSGATNGEVIALARRHQAIVVAEDRGFGSLVTYPLGSHGGIIILKIRRAADVEVIQQHLARAIRTIPPEQLAGALLTVDRTKSRLRQPA